MNINAGALGKNLYVAQDGTQSRTKSCVLVTLKSKCTRSLALAFLIESSNKATYRRKLVKFSGMI